MASGIRFHVVEGGHGSPILLLAGFPQSWYAWRHVMPILAEKHHVIAVDLPGQGDSSKPESGFDTDTTGERLHELARALGLNRYALAGHDIGAWVAYPFAAKYADALTHLVLLDANIPGVTLPLSITLGPDNWKTWHFLFNSVPDLPEALLQGRERILIEWFFNHKTAHRSHTFSEADLDEYERVYRQAGTLRCMLGYYRAVEEDRIRNEVLQHRQLRVPVLAFGGEFGSAPKLFDALKPLAKDLHGGLLPDCGHYIPEEQPEMLAQSMLTFLARTPQLDPEI